MKNPITIFHFFIKFLELKVRSFVFVLCGGGGIQYPHTHCYMMIYCADLNNGKD